MRALSLIKQSCDSHVVEGPFFGAATKGGAIGETVPSFSMGIELELCKLAGAPDLLAAAFSLLEDNWKVLHGVPQYIVIKLLR